MSLKKIHLQKKYYKVAYPFQMETNALHRVVPAKVTSQGCTRTTEGNYYMSM